MMCNWSTCYQQSSAFYSLPISREASLIRDTLCQGPCTRCGREIKKRYIEVGTRNCICSKCYDADYYRERTKKPKLAS